MLDGDGALALSHNWSKPGWVGSHGGLSGVIDDDGTSVEGASPGFVDAAAQDFHLLESSDAVDAGGALHPDVLPEHDVVWQYASTRRASRAPPTARPTSARSSCPSPAWAGVWRPASSHSPH